MSDENKLFSTDAETSLLTILLNHPNLIYDLRGIHPYMMSSSPHQVLLDTMLELSNQNLVPDITLVATKLEQSGKLDNVGGIDYLKYLVSQKHPHENLPEFERSVINSYKAKKIISLTSGLTNNVIQTGNVDDIIVKLKDDLDNLSLTAGTDKTFSLSSALPEIWENITKKVKNPGILGATTGIEYLDIHTSGFCGGDYWVIASRPSMGKTALALNCLLKTSLRSNKRPLLFSKEMSKEPLIERMLAIESGVPISYIRLGNLNNETLEKVSKAIKELNSLPIYLDTSFTTDKYYIESTIRKYVKMYDVDIVFIDYLQLLAERGDKATHELGEISRHIKLLAGDLNIPIVLLSQLNREVEMREDKRPILSDLRQCGNIEEDADIVIMLYRDEYYNKNSPDKGVMECLIRKQRNGPIGVVRTKINLDTNEITG